MNEVMTAEGEFFSALIKNNREADIFLLSGIKLHGRVLRETDFCILLQMNAAREINDNVSLVYKSAIASVVPCTLREQARRGSKVTRVAAEYTA
jgi:RNA chaperone Hfq